MKIAMVGLGKMGMNLVKNMLDSNYSVIVYDLDKEKRDKAKALQVKVANSLPEIVNSFEDGEKKIIWSMVPHGKPTDAVFESMLEILSSNDIFIDGGNSNYKESIKKSAQLEEKGIYFLDVGTSGGVSGARHNGCFMIGGQKSAFKYVEKLFKDIADENGYLYTGEAGSGHYLKMVHNGIEYGMMEAIAEGFEILEKSHYKYQLAEVARVWNHGSVIRSWLMELAEAAFEKDPGLSEIMDVAHASGEAQWTTEEAFDLQVPVPVIALSLMVRMRSMEEESFTTKVVSALRNGFGGHEMEKK